MESLHNTTRHTPARPRRLGTLVHTGDMDLGFGENTVGSAAPAHREIGHRT
ncbi:hypothetical protein AB0I82_00915 [Streptomyces sp. NPDC050315]|uniref:hypothetical protein n=1 Tax=Streptomyces sp. NPDC050315 TaxID=3155039 RepID=UPI0034426F17